MENTFYNQEIKERFLNELDNSILKTFTTLLFRKAKKVEAVYNKDIYNMTLEELGEVASNLSCSTANAVYINVVKMEEYIDWAIENGLRKSNINPLSNTEKTNWSKKFVATYKNYYFTREKIEDMAHELVNEADRALLLALFEGIKGKGFSELINLKPQDITEKDGVYWAHLKEDDGEERTLQISKLLADNLLMASRQTEYINKNDMSQVADGRSVSKLEESPYIFKKAAKGRREGGKLTLAFITRKFILFKEVFGLEYLKAKHIEDSGKMHYANKLQNDGELTTGEMLVIAERFDTPYTYANGDMKYRNTTLIRRVLDIKEFEELYGYKMKYKTERINS